MEEFSREYDPLTGVITRSGFVDDKLVIRKDADLSALVQHTTAQRNDEDQSRQGIKNGWWKVASIDPITQIELLNIGIDLYKSSAREIVAGLRKLNKEYFITTTKRV
jgi:hypothetical protein